MLRLIVSPFDLGRRDHGMGLMARRMLDAGALDVLRDAGHEVETVTVEPATLSGQQVGDYFAVQAQVAAEVRRAVTDGAFPFLLGGNCGGTLGAVSGLADPARSGVVWFDAHADVNTAETTDSGYLDGMPVAALTGRCWQRLAGGTEGLARIPDEHVLLAGVREIDPAERELVADSAITLVGPDDLASPAFDGAVSALAERVDSVHLHVDLDVIDIGDGRVNEFHSSRGPILDDLLTAFGVVARRCRLNGLSLTSYDPTYADSDGLALRSGMRVLAGLARLGS